MIIRKTRCEICTHFYKQYIEGCKYTFELPHYAPCCDAGVNFEQLNGNPCPYYKHNKGLIRIKE